MVYDPARVTEPTGRAHWPLDASVDVVISVDAASKALNDLKVRGPFPAEGQSPRQRTPHSHTALVSQPHKPTMPKSTPTAHPATSSQTPKPVKPPSTPASTHEGVSTPIKSQPACSPPQVHRHPLGSQLHTDPEQAPPAPMQTGALSSSRACTHTRTRASDTGAYLDARVSPTKEAGNLSHRRCDAFSLAPRRLHTHSDPRLTDSAFSPVTRGK